MKLLSEDKRCLNIELLSGELHEAVTWSTLSNLYNYVKLKHCMKLFLLSGALYEAGFLLLLLLLLLLF